MEKTRFILSVVALTALAGICQADESDENSKIVADFWKCDSPTNGFWGLNDKPAPSGIELGLGLTTVYQANVKGGTSTNDILRQKTENIRQSGKLKGCKNG